MKLALEEKKGFKIIHSEGTVDLYSSPELREEIQRQFKKCTTLIIDLSGVEYIDSSGIATLVEGLQVSKKLGKRFILTGITEQVKDVFNLARLEKVFSIYNSVEEIINE